MWQVYTNRCDKNMEMDLSKLYKYIWQDKKLSKWIWQN